MSQFSDVLDNPFYKKYLRIDGTFNDMTKISFPGSS